MPRLYVEIILSTAMFAQPRAAVPHEHRRDLIN